MGRDHRFQITVIGTGCALVAFSAVAVAQKRPQDLACRKTETQAECHSRLQCKQDEELEDCQKRLLKCRANETLEDCKKRVGAQPEEGDGGRRDDADRTGRDREADDERDQGRDREDADRERGGRGDRDEGAWERGGRGDRDEGARSRGGRDGGRGDDGGRGGRGGRDDGGQGFQANKTFGLGLELGEPTGLNGKYFLSEAGALNFGVGWIYRHYYYDDGLHIYLDYLHHPLSLASTEAFELPFYIGGGVRFWDFEYCDSRFCDDGSALGIRIPIGVSFDFNAAPLDIFIQIVPVIDFLFDDYADRFGDRSHVGVDLSVGIRYWFM